MKCIAFAALSLLANQGVSYQATLDQLRDAQNIPGVSAAIAVGDDVLFAGGSGLADIGANEPMTADTVLYAGSVSKVFTAVLVMNLIEQGTFSLDDGVDVEGIDPAVTVKHLLTHASGLRREGPFGYWFSGVFPTSDDLRQYLASAPYRSEPGRELHYSNIGYATLGLLAERAGNRPYGELLVERVLRPLAMESSGAPGPTRAIARGYSPPGRVIPSSDRPFAGLGSAVGDRRLREYHNAAAMSPAFGVYTTANDLIRLGVFLLGADNQGVLSRATRQQMLTRYRPGWGLGMRVARLNGSRVARHDGWFAAHKSHLLMDIDSRIAVVVLANGDNARPAEIAEALLLLVSNADPRTE